MNERKLHSTRRINDYFSCIRSAKFQCDSGILIKRGTMMNANYRLGFHQRVRLIKLLFERAFIRFEAK